jgi:hypothetical protein
MYVGKRLNNMQKSIKKASNRNDLKPFLSNGDEEDRTLDLTDANRMLSQLSYVPMSTA